MNKKILFYLPLAHVMSRTFNKKRRKAAGSSDAPGDGFEYQSTAFGKPPALFDDPPLHLALDRLIQCIGTDARGL